MEGQPTPTAVHLLWGNNWPETITLGEAADKIRFDLYVGDDDATVLTKTMVDVGPLYKIYGTFLWDDWNVEAMEEIAYGLDTNPGEVPPVVFDAEGRFRDGHHRLWVSHQRDFKQMPAYARMPFVFNPA
jgi:hypothetical protein